jgi:hypothetical protein
MGGQACVFYGAAEFSRDLDLLILVDAHNLDRLRLALDELNARATAVPPFAQRFLDAGHASHFRCSRPDVAGLRVDLMSRLREMDGFDQLWQRRTTIEAEEQAIDLLSLEDLVCAKKTQRDKDWPMIRRLVEQNYFQHRSGPTPGQLQFWLRELRTPGLLISVAERWPREANLEAGRRSAVTAALEGSEERVAEFMELEEKQERDRDRIYWQPLKRELEELRRGMRS